MKILVCVKPIAEGSAIRDGNVPRTLSLKQMPNPLDLSAMEEALRVHASMGGQVTALSVGPARAEDTLRKAVMMGANRALRLWDDSLRDVDAGGIARVLAEAAKEIGFDLLLCGARSSDTGSELVGALLAEHLGLPLICRAIGLRFDRETRRIVAEKKLEKGERETYAANLPAILTIERGAEARYASRNWVYRLFRERIEVLTLADIRMTETLPPPQVRTIALMPPRPRTKIGVRISGLSLQEKLALMRGRASQPPGQLVVCERPEDAASKIQEHLDRWFP